MSKRCGGPLIVPPGSNPHVYALLPWCGRLNVALLAVAFGLSACGESPVTQSPVTEPEVPADSVVAIQMSSAERPLSFVGMSVRISARAVDANGSPLFGARLSPDRFAWASDAPGVVSVDSLGNLTAVSEGSARVTATSAGVTGTTTVTVRNVIRPAWTHPLHGPPGGLSIGEDGTVYIADTTTLYSLSPDGTAGPAVDMGSRALGASAIGPEGTLYVGTNGVRSSVMAVDRPGTVLWSFEGIGWVSSSPAVGPDGTIYAASRDSTLYALHPDGRTKWEFRAQDEFGRSSPAIARDGTILALAFNGQLHALNPDGTERWSFAVGDTVWSSPSIGVDGTIYLVGPDEHLSALDPDGGLRWQLPLDGVRHSSPSFGADGTIYIGGRGLHAVAPGGTLQWTYPGFIAGVGVEIFGTPVVAADGTIYAGGSRLYAVNPDGTHRWDYPGGGQFRGVPAIGVDGTIYAATSDTVGVGTLHAITELDGNNGGFENAPWPKERGGRANTGRAGGN